MSDTHDNLKNLDKAIKVFKEMNVELVIHCGDYIAPFSAKKLVDSGLKVIGIFGNNDSEKALIYAIAKEKGADISSDVRELTLRGRKILVMHGLGSKENTINIVNAIAKSGDYDIVIYGHTHEARAEKINKCLVVNPGEVFGHLTGKASVAVIDLDKLEAKLIELR